MVQGETMISSHPKTTLILFDSFPKLDVVIIQAFVYRAVVKLMFPITNQAILFSFPSFFWSK